MRGHAKAGYDNEHAIRVVCLIKIVVVLIG